MSGPGVVGVARPAWSNSDRRSALPPNWPKLRNSARKRNPEQICHECRLPGGETLDHIDGDRDNHSPDNLDWIHDWRSVRDGRSAVNCHDRKTKRQQPSAIRVEVHPALR